MDRERPARTGSPGSPARDATASGEGPAPVVVRVRGVIAPLVPDYIEARRVELEKMRDLIQAGDVEALGGIGHRLKGSGAGYGFREISELGARMEDAATAGDLVGVVAAVERLGSYLDAVTVLVDE